MTTTATPAIYTDQDGNLYDEDRQAQIRKFEADLLDGTVFARCGASSRSVRGYQPVTNHRLFAHLVTTIGKLAGEGDQCAQVAADVIHAAPLYQGRHEMYAKAWEVAAATIREGYDDVVLRSGPEPGRPSTWHKPFALGAVFCVYVHLTEATAKESGSVPGLGWCASAIARAHGFRTSVTAGYTPSVVAR